MIKSGNNLQLFLEIIGKDRTKTAFNQLGNSISSIRGEVSLLSGLFSGGLFLGIKKSVDMASELEETQNKFAVVFANIRKESEATAKSLGSFYDLSQNTTKAQLSDMGNLFQAIGYGQKEALDLAEKTLKRGADLASFNNLDTIDSIQRLKKGLLGNYEVLEAFGIKLYETDIKQALLAKGMGNLTGEAEKQAKAMVVLETVMNQTKLAEGDYDRSRASFANTQRAFKAALEDTTTVLGQAFLPMATELLTNITPIIKSTGDWINENKELVNVLGKTALGIGAVVTALYPLRAGYKIISGLAGTFKGLTKQILGAKVAMEGMKGIGGIGGAGTTIIPGGVGKKGGGIIGMGKNLIKNPYIIGATALAGVGLSTTVFRDNAKKWKEGVDAKSQDVWKNGTNVDKALQGGKEAVSSIWSFVDWVGSSFNNSGVGRAVIGAGKQVGDTVVKGGLDMYDDILDGTPEAQLRKQQREIEHRRKYMPGTVSGYKQMIEKSNRYRGIGEPKEVSNNTQINNHNHFDIKIDAKDNSDEVVRYIKRAVETTQSAEKLGISA